MRAGELLILTADVYGSRLQTLLVNFIFNCRRRFGRWESSTWHACLSTCQFCWYSLCLLTEVRLAVLNIVVNDCRRWKRTCRHVPMRRLQSDTNMNTLVACPVHLGQFSRVTASAVCGEASTEPWFACLLVRQRNWRFFRGLKNTLSCCRYYVTCRQQQKYLACLCESLAHCTLSLKRLSAGPGFNPQTWQNKLFQDYWRACFEINFSDRQEGLMVSSLLYNLSPLSGYGAVMVVKCTRSS